MFTKKELKQLEPLGKKTERLPSMLLVASILWLLLATSLLVVTFWGATRDGIPIEKAFSLFVNGPTRGETYTGAEASIFESGQIGFCGLLGGLVFFALAVGFRKHYRLLSKCWNRLVEIEEQKKT